MLKYGVWGDYMLVLPIVNRDRIMNVRISLKNVHKIKSGVKYDDIRASDLIVNNNSFTDSSYGLERIEPANIIQFIRNSSIRDKKSFFVSTKEEDYSDLYDLYKIDYPLEKVTEGLDKLFGSAVLDLKDEIPGRIKGRYVDFEMLGVTDHITDDELERLECIAKSSIDNYAKIIKDNNLETLIDTLGFLELFDCEVIENSTVKLEIFKKNLGVFNAIHSKDIKRLNYYLDLALANQEAYSRLSRLYNIVYNDSLKWIHNSKDKIKIKKTLEKKEVA